MGKSRGEGGGRAKAKSFQLGQRVDVLSTNKRKPLEVRGRGATVVGLPGNGWIFVALADEKAPPLRIQQRYLVHERTEAHTKQDLGSGGGNSSSAHPAPKAEGLRPIKLRIVEIGRAVRAVADLGEIGQAIASVKAVTPGKPQDASSSPLPVPKAAAASQPAPSPVHLETRSSVSPHHLKEVCIKPPGRFTWAHTLWPLAASFRHFVADDLHRCHCMCHHTGCLQALDGIGLAEKCVHISRQVLRKVRNDVLDAESHIPWSAVRSFWRSRRSKWRAATKAAEGVSDMAGRLSELRNALVAETATFPACGPEWQAGMDACIAATGTHAQLLGVWEELRGGIGAWLAARTRPHAHLHHASQQAVAARVMATMARWQAAAGDDEEAQEDFLGQVPVEAICDHRSDNLAAARALIEKEHKVNAREEACVNATTATSIASNLPAGGGAHVGVSTTSAPAHSAPLSPQGIIDGHLAVPLDDNFDSGAETEVGSAVTVFSDAWSGGYDSG